MGLRAAKATPAPSSSHQAPCASILPAVLRPSLSQSEKMGKARLLFPRPLGLLDSFVLLNQQRCLNQHVRSGEHLLHLKKQPQHLPPSPITGSKKKIINLSLN